MFEDNSECTVSRLGEGGVRESELRVRCVSKVLDNGQGCD